MNTNSARSKRTKSHRSSQYDCPDSAGAATAAASRSAAACSRRRDPAAAAAISSRSSATARRGGGAHCAGACGPSARGANGRRAHVAARPHPREGLRLHVTAVGGRWRPLGGGCRCGSLPQPCAAVSGLLLAVCAGIWVGISIPRLPCQLLGGRGACWSKPKGSPGKISRENLLVLASWWQLGHLQAAWRNSCTPWALKHATA